MTSRRRWVQAVAAGSVAALLAGACGGGSTDSEDASASTTTTVASTTTASPTTTAPTTTAAPTTTTTEAPAVDVPTVVERVTIAGEQEMVFDWTTDRCEDEHIPDISSRAIRNADGVVQLYIGHYVTYRMIGPDLDTVATDCSVRTMMSAFDPDPSRFDEAGWIAAPYTEDGRTVHAVIHNEYRGFVFEPADRCPLGDYLSCIDVTLTMAVSTDGGATFDHVAEPPDHLAASLPDVYNASGEPSGLWQTSNIVAPGDGFHYLMTNINAYDDPETGDGRQWSCLLRAPDLTDPTSWRYWDGAAFDGVFVDPYRADADPDAICAPVARNQIGAEIMETIVWDDAVGRYVALGMSNDPAQGGTWGVYASFSDDLLTWTGRELVIELPMGPSVADEDRDLRYAYPAIIDPDSPSLNFDTSDGAAYLYLTRMNAGGGSLDRDLVRYPITIEAVPIDPPRWDFDSAGDSEGWAATNQLEPFTVADGLLGSVTTGDDPYMEVVGLRFPGPTNPTLRIRMRVDAGVARTDGQVFFVTDEQPNWGESKSVLFRISGDGEWVDYEIDMSAASGWAATITGLRIDPGTEVDAVVEIDAIEFG